MNEKLEKFIEKIKRPRVWFATVWLLCTIVIIAFTIVSLVLPILPEFASYALYGVSAVALAYAVYIVVKAVPHTRAWVIQTLNKWQFTKTVLENYGFRTTVFAICTFAISVGYALWEGAIAIVSRSVWFGALAGYYLVLALNRGLLLNSKRGIVLKAKRQEVVDHTANRIKIFRSTGISLLALTLALSSAVFYIVKTGRGFSYPGLTIYASAAYAFYKIGMSIYNFVKAKKYEDLSVWAIRNINLADALVSILALQTALLAQFAQGQDVRIYNLLTGASVIAVIIFVGLYMIIKANYMLKKHEEDKRNARR